jgi:hypothetical protein
MKKRNSKSIDRSWRRDERWSTEAEWSGTAMIYTASGDGSFALSGDYQVSYDDESDPEDLRAARLFQASQGQEGVGKVSYDKLGDELGDLDRSAGNAHVAD